MSRKNDELRGFYSFIEVDSVARRAARLSLRRGGLCEGFEDGLMIYSRERLFTESFALARTLQERSADRLSPRSILLSGGGMYDTLLLLIASSLLSCPLTLSEALPDDISDYELIISADPRRDGARGGRIIFTDELGSLALGKLSDTEDMLADFSFPKDRRFEIIFLSGAGREAFSEPSALAIAKEYKHAEGLSRHEACFSTLPPYTKEGFFGGLLAPMLYSGRFGYAPTSDELFEQIKLCAPSTLLSYREVAIRISKEMQSLKNAKAVWQRGRGSHPLRRRLDRIFPRTRAALRRLKMISIRYPFGSKLSRIVCIGEPERESAELLHSFGIFSHSLLSVDRCGLAGFRISRDPDGRWRLPRSLSASMCDVGVGGVGKLTFIGDHLADGTAEWHSTRSGSFRSELLYPRLLVSDIWGFPYKNHTFFAKRLNNF